MDWAWQCVEYSVEETYKNGLRGIREGATKRWRDALKKANQLRVQWVGNPGTSVYEREWDVLVILDACRVDLMKEVADEYPFIGPIERFESLASVSKNWMRRNFEGEHAVNAAKTAYVTGNPFSRYLDDSTFGYFDEVWRYAWDDDLHTIPARPLTQRAINVWRRREEQDVERMIVHYMQPHAPFVPEPNLGTYGAPDDFGYGFADDIWSQIGYTIPYEHVWRAFRDNLRYVLNDVEVLLKNMDADQPVLSADHGNAFGERGIWGHPIDMLLPCIREVPWIETSAVDEHTHEPTLEQVEGIKDEQAVTNRLRNLGYAE